MIYYIAVGTWLLYLIWTGYTILSAMLYKKKDDSTFIGKLIYWHGVVWMIGMVAGAILTATAIFCILILGNLRMMLIGIN